MNEWMQEYEKTQQYDKYEGAREKRKVDIEARNNFCFFLFLSPFLLPSLFLSLSLGESCEVRSERAKLESQRFSKRK